MRVATYNIWNAPTRQQERWAALTATLAQLDADIIALQEVPTAFGRAGRDVGAVLAAHSHYPYSCFRAYPDAPDEGLALLSRYPLDTVGAEWDGPRPDLPACAIGAHGTIAGQQLAVINLHLDWASSLVREQQIVHVLAWHAAWHTSGGASLLLGDFNATPESSVYRFLHGQQSLAGAASSPWIDLAAYVAFMTHTIPAATLDFTTNPRWAATPTLERPMRVDWLMLRTPVGHTPPQVHAGGCFGTAPPTPQHVVPSDHYGVYADLVFR